MIRLGEYLHNEADLMDKARKIFHGADPGPLLAEVPDWQFAQLSSMLQGMENRRLKFMAEMDMRMNASDPTVIQVFAAEDGSSPTFAYTVGLYPTWGGELVVRGFGAQTGDLAGAAIVWVKNGSVPLVPGDYALEGGGMVRVVPFAGDPADFGWANRAHLGVDYPRFQLIFADDEDRFPGDDGCKCAEFQLKGLTS